MSGAGARFDRPRDEEHGFHDSGRRGARLPCSRAHAQNPEKFERPEAPKAQPAPAKPQSVAPKPAAPAGGTTQLDEITRKADAREKEDGFCNRAKWPERDSQSAVAYFETAKPGDVRVGLRAAEGISICIFNRVPAAFVEDGQRCKRVHGWGRRVGGDCTFRTIKECRDKAGSWKPVVESENK